MPKQSYFSWTLFRQNVLLAIKYVFREYFGVGMFWWIFAIKIVVITNTNTVNPTKMLRWYILVLLCMVPTTDRPTHFVFVMMLRFHFRLSVAPTYSPWCPVFVMTNLKMLCKNSHSSCIDFKTIRFWNYINRTERALRPPFLHRNLGRSFFGCVFEWEISVLSIEFRQRRTLNGI